MGRGSPHVTTGDLPRLVHLGTPNTSPPPHICALALPSNMFIIVHLRKWTVGLRLKGLLVNACK